MITPASSHSWVEISASALAYNVALYKKILGHQKLGVVIKSNAYGHGLLQIGTLLNDNPEVDLLMVAHLQEAITLRNAGIGKPILLLNPERLRLQEIIAYELHTILTDYDMIEKLEQAGNQHKKKVALHIKVDTGLSRFGFHPTEIIALCKKIKAYQWLELTGIYTHFAESNSSDLTFTHEQAQQFYALLDHLEQEGMHATYYHTSNSAGISSLAHHPKINLGRLGAGAYGLWPSEHTRTISWMPLEYQHLKPVLSWKTRIVHIKTVPTGTPVGYNRSYLTNKETRIGILPVGYYDGYDKRLSNKGVVHIKGQSAPIIGTIGMNATMIDLTMIPKAQIDDEVILAGNHTLVTPYDLAQQTGCFNPRQITVQINPEIPRIIV